MPDIGTMHQLNPEPPHIGTMHQLGPEPLHTGEIITPQAQAEEYAREAQESADNAALSAAAAQSAAETAQQAAESIAPALDEKAAAIHTAAGPAPIVSIPDAAAAPVDALTVGIEPVQDLHGYDHPWPAGGGANLLDLDKASYNTNAYGFTVTRDGDGVRITGTATQTGNLSFNLIIDYSGETLGGKGYVLQVFDVTSGYTVGAVWGFRTESEKAFAISLINITAGQNVNCTMKLSVAATSQTSWTPYSNICPISGWTGAKVTRTGKNLLPTQNTVKSGNMTFVGGSDYWIRLKAGTYAMSEEGSSAYLYWRKEGTTDNNIIHTSLSHSGTFTLTEETIVRFWYYASSSDTTYSNIQLELGSTATAYEPYQGSTYDITFPTEAGTVYGGTLDVTTGTLTVDMAMVDLGTLNWSYMQNQGVFYSTTEIPAKESEVICSCYIYSKISVGNRPDKSINVCLPYFGENKVSVKDTAYSDAAIFKAAMSGVQLVYELATPIIYTLTSQEIRTLLGANNIWADTGDVTVGYKADTKLYIDMKFTELQALILEH